MKLWRNNQAISSTSFPRDDPRLSGSCAYCDDFAWVEISSHGSKQLELKSPYELIRNCLFIIIIIVRNCRIFSQRKPFVGFQCRVLIHLILANNNFISAFSICVHSSWGLNSHIRERTKYNFIVIKCHGAQHFLSTWIPTLTLYIKFWSYVFGTNMTTVVYCMHLNIRAKLQSNKWPIFKLFRQGRA